MNALRDAYPAQDWNRWDVCFIDCRGFSQGLAVEQSGLTDPWGIKHIGLHQRFRRKYVDQAGMSILLPVQQFWPPRVDRKTMFCCFDYMGMHESVQMMVSLRGLTLAKCSRARLVVERHICENVWRLQSCCGGCSECTNQDSAVEAAIQDKIHRYLHARG